MSKVITKAQYTVAVLTHFTADLSSQSKHIYIAKCRK